MYVYMCVWQCHSGEEVRDVLKGEGAKRGYGGAGGVLLLVYAMLLTRGLQDVKADMDDPNNTLTGQFGHCTQEVQSICTRAKRDCLPLGLLGPKV